MQKQELVPNKNCLKGLKSSKIIIIAKGNIALCVTQTPTFTVFHLALIFIPSILSEKLTAAALNCSSDLDISGAALEFYFEGGNHMKGPTSPQAEAKEAGLNVPF